MPPRSRGLKQVSLLCQAVIGTNNATPFNKLPFQIQRCISGTSYHVSTTKTGSISTAQLLHSRRSFSTSSTLQKKSSKSSSKSSSPSKSHDHVPDNKATANRDAEVDPYDFTELEAGISQAITRLKDGLAKTRDAGRVTPEMVEALPVELNVKGGDTQGGNAHKEKTYIRDIASVAPKGGRMLQVFCGEEAHVKPLTNAIQASDYSLTPQPDAHNPLLLLVPVPPATAETRAQAATEAKKVMEKASLAVRTARGDAQKNFRKMELGKLVIKDELRKAHNSMEEVVKKGQDEVKRVFEAALKSMER